MRRKATPHLCECGRPMRPSHGHERCVVCRILAEKAAKAQRDRDAIDGYSVADQLAIIRRAELAIRRGKLRGYERLEIRDETHPNTLPDIRYQVGDAILTLEEFDFHVGRVLREGA